jgi:hypothetical protein
VKTVSSSPTIEKSSMKNYFATGFSKNISIVDDNDNKMIVVQQNSNLGWCKLQKIIIRDVHSCLK